MIRLAVHIACEAGFLAAGIGAAIVIGASLTAYAPDIARALGIVARK